MLMTNWALDFEWRDFDFLAGGSGILPTLQSFVTITRSADMAKSSLVSASCTSSSGDLLSRRRRPEELTAPQWTPWSLDKIRDGLIHVRIASTRREQVFGADMRYTGIHRDHLAACRGKCEVPLGQSSLACVPP